jgi:hypothetical protein
MKLRFAIDESFRQLSQAGAGSFPGRPEFRDPLLVSIQQVPLSRRIDEELDRFYSPSGPVDLISRVFRRFRRD